MENRDTISYLNTKIWYRLLKVAYILAFLPVLVLSISAGYLFTEPEFDNGKSYIKCADGKELGLDENDIHLDSSYIYSWYDQKIRLLCLPATGQYRNKTTGEIISAEEFSRRYASEIPKNYELISIYAERNLIKAIGFSLLLTITTVLFFELIKRTFYYVILGRFNPKTR